ncbi:MAG TPA: response regulator transcription factor [Bacillota bacterium]|nr:response regulator transcription factor [Bacillota bacterium]
MDKTIRLFIVDDHPIVRAGLKAILSGYPELEMVGEAADGDEAVQLMESLQPDLILMDIRMPRLNGVEAIRRIKATHRHVQMIILTTYDDDELILSGIQAGAQGYLLKDTPPDELVRAIQIVAGGGSLLPPNVAAKLIQRINQPIQNGQEILTERELEILKYMAKGLANKSIAGELSISENTVKTHIAKVFQKLGVNDRTEAVTTALQNGILSLKL